jgi:hypothetical protein
MKSVVIRSSPTGQTVSRPTISIALTTNGRYSLPVHDSPQIDLDTGQIMSDEIRLSKLDQSAVDESSKASSTDEKTLQKKLCIDEIKQVFNELSRRQQQILSAGRVSMPSDKETRMRQKASVQVKLSARDILTA